MEMTGSDKQIAWANKIKAEADSNVRAYGAEFAEAWAMLTTDATNAEWWIDNRNNFPPAILLDKPVGWQISSAIDSLFRLAYTAAEVKNVILATRDVYKRLGIKSGFKGDVAFGPFESVEHFVRFMKSTECPFFQTDSVSSRELLALYAACIEVPQ